MARFFVRLFFALCFVLVPFSPAADETKSASDDAVQLRTWTVTELAELEGHSAFFASQACFSDQNRQEATDLLVYIGLRGYSPDVSCACEFGRECYSNEHFLESYYWYQLVLKQNVAADIPEAYYRLGCMYFEGKGVVSRDQAQGRDFLERAVDAGYIEAYYSCALANLYFKPEANIARAKALHALLVVRKPVQAAQLKRRIEEVEDNYAAVSGPTSCCGGFCWLLCCCGCGSCLDEE